jgi:hypothetical protein
MSIRVKFEYQDEVTTVADSVRAEEKQGSLFVYDKDRNVVGRFASSKVEHWWSEAAKEKEAF